MIDWTDAVTDLDLRLPMISFGFGLWDGTILSIFLSGRKIVSLEVVRGTGGLNIFLPLPSS